MDLETAAQLFAVSVDNLAEAIDPAMIDAYCTEYSDDVCEYGEGIAQFRIRARLGLLSAEEIMDAFQARRGRSYEHTTYMLDVLDHAQLYDLAWSIEDEIVEPTVHALALFAMLT